MRGDRYLIISSDCHAGLPNEQYRDWLDPEYRDAFDQSLADRARMMELAARGILNEEFAEEWERENEEGLRGGWDAGPPRQGARRRRRGRRGHLPRRRRGVRRAPRLRSVPGCQPAATSPPICCWPAPGPTTAGWPSCARLARAARRHRPRAHLRPRRGRDRDPSGPRVGSAGRHPHPVDVGHAPAVPRPALRAGVGDVRGAGHARCTCTPGRPTRPRTARTSACT